MRVWTLIMLGKVLETKSIKTSMKENPDITGYSLINHGLMMNGQN
jgi:hypothetical protein